MSETLILNNVRLSRPDLWVKRQPSPGMVGEPKYGAQGIFDLQSETGQLVQNAFCKVAFDQWGANWQNVIGSIGWDKLCLRDGDKKLNKDGSPADGYAGKFFVKASNKQQPMVVAHQLYQGKVVQIAQDGTAWVDGRPVSEQGIVLPFEVVPPYAGCIVNMKIDIYAMDKTNRGVYATLLAVQYAGKGDPFGAPPPDATGFGDVAGVTGGFAGAPTGQSFGGSAMPAFGGAPAQAPAASPFGQPAASPFGAAPAASPFGQPQQAASPFGQQAASPFGGAPVDPFAR